MTLIKDAIDTIAALSFARKPRLEVVEVPGKKVLLDQQSGEVGTLYTAPETRGGLVLGDLKSLCDWCGSFPGDLTGSGDIVISRKGTTFAITPRIGREHERSKANVPFYDAFLPKGPMSLRAFIAWIDLIRPGLDPKDAEAIDACLRAVTVAEGAQSTVTQTGAAIAVKTETARGVSTERPFPKRITAAIPFGDPAFVTPVRFSLTLESRGTELIAHAVVDELELGDLGETNGPRDRFVSWARDLLSGLDGWCVMAGA